MFTFVAMNKNHPITKWLKQERLTKEYLAVKLGVSVQTTVNMTKRDILDNKYLIVMQLKNLGVEV